jgi:hypothetical protein
LWAGSGAAFGQAPLEAPADFWRQPLVLPMLQPWASSTSCAGLALPAEREPRIRLFGIQPGFLGDPVGLQSDDDPPAGSADALAAPDPDADLLSRLEVVIGTDNPFFDFRSPYDPGGVGYYKLYSQYQLIDSGTTCWSVGLEAVAPAGLEQDGVARGPTVLSPTLSWYQDLGSGTALQGFVCKHIHANSRWADRLEQSIHYGMAIQSPLIDATSNSCGCVHMFMAALGRCQAESFTGRQAGANFEMLPGLHWQVRENWWLSGGVVVPIGPDRYEGGLWQITCSWRF